MKILQELLTVLVISLLLYVSVVFCVPENAGKWLAKMTIAYEDVMLNYYEP